MENTFVIPVIRDDLIDRCLATLYERTPPGFYVYVVDQTREGIAEHRLRGRYENLMVLRTPRTSTHTTGNLGFAKAVNLGLALVETPYATICNDDVEFIDQRWWPGVVRTFERLDRLQPPRPAAIVTPMSVKLPYWAIGAPPGHDRCLLPYREVWSEEDWQFLVGQSHPVNDKLTIRPRTVGEAAELFCSVIRADRLRQVGPLNERFYPGGGEDYDYNRRIRTHGYSCVSTTEAWVFHHWGRTRGSVAAGRSECDEALRWNDLRSLWQGARKAPSVDEMPPLTRRPL